MQNQKKPQGITIQEADVQAMVDCLDVAAKQYGANVLANEICKAGSTLRNELAGVPGHKLGLITAILVMARTGDFQALDRIEAMFGRVGIPLPTSTHEDPAPLLTEEGRLAKEFGEHMAVLGAALMDGTVDAAEARKCLRELDDVVKKALAVRLHLKHLAKG
jgi:hypothetical protein